jgi:hypothetical protein
MRYDDIWNDSSAEMTFTMMTSMALMWENFKGGPSQDKRVSVLVALLYRLRNEFNALEHMGTLCGLAFPATRLDVKTCKVVTDFY